MAKSRSCCVARLRVASRHGACKPTLFPLTCHVRANVQVCKDTERSNRLVSCGMKHRATTRQPRPPEPRADVRAPPDLGSSCRRCLPQRGACRTTFGMRCSSGSNIARSMMCSKARTLTPRVEPPAFARARCKRRKMSTPSGSNGRGCGLEYHCALCVGNDIFRTRRGGEEN